MCRDNGEQLWWEWPVDPLTREVQVDPADLDEIRRELEICASWATHDQDTADRHALVGQNIKFDAGMLAALGIPIPWPAVRDTLLLGHLLASNQPKDLTSLALQYLGVDIEPHEKALKKACDEARRMCRSKFPEWRIAKAGLPEMPSAKETCWKYDTWLPKTLVKHLWETSEAGRAWASGGRPGEEWTTDQLAANIRFDSEGGYSSEIPFDPPEDPSLLSGWDYRPPDLGGDHPWWTVLETYANADSAVTVALWSVMWRLACERGLDRIYRERLRVLPVVAQMEAGGVTVSKKRLRQLQAEFGEESERAGRVCVNIAAGLGYELTLPKAGANECLMAFCFRESAVERAEKERAKAEEKARKSAARNKGKAGQSLFDPGDETPPLGEVAPCLDLPVVSRTDTGRPSLDKSTLEHYVATLPSRSRGGAFLAALRNKRKRDTALSYMDGYERFWLPLAVRGQIVAGFYRLFPNLNPTGTDTLRFSSNHPNEQNISKQVERCPLCLGKGCEPCNGTGEVSLNLRLCFGPAPGREWWSCDAKNIEARLPAYESGEQELISLYETPDTPPYYGSAHLLNFSTVYPDIWERELREVGIEKVGPYCKKKYAATWYQWCKNGGFAVQYGAMDREGGGGTADRAFRKNGAHALLKARFARLETLNQAQIRFADKHGYVETIPDRSVDLRRGYPLLVTRTEWGRVLPTVPLNYHIQGSACWWMCRAMVRCDEQLDAWRREGFDASIVMQVHDELVFDFPKSAVHPREDYDPTRPDKVKLNGRSNLWRIRRLQKLLEQGGNDFAPPGRPNGIPTPTSAEYHEVSWAEGVTLG